MDDVVTVSYEPFSALWSVIAHGSDLLLTLSFQDGSRRETHYLPVGDPDRYVRVLNSVQDRDLRVGLIPRKDKHPDGLAPSRCLWVSVENKVSARLLEAFRPKPTLLFGKGSKQVGVWWLRSPLPMTADSATDWVTRANKRLAFALKGNSRHADPEWLMPVLPLLAASPVMHKPADVVGRLRDAPVRSGLSRKLQTV